MTLPVTNASRGRSFLKIGASYRKTEIHNGPKQTESPVSNLSVDSDILRKLDFTSLIKEICRSVGQQKGGHVIFLAPFYTWQKMYCFFTA